MAEPFLPVAAAPAVPPRYGLVVSARAGATANLSPSGTPSPSDAERWEAGFSWAPEGCGAVQAVDRCVPGSLTIPDNPDVGNFRPVALVTADRCAPWDLDRDWQGRARRQLLAGSPTALAREFWKGTLATAKGYPNAFLASSGADVASASPLSPNDALACLEQGIAESANGQRGMIHCTVGTATAWQIGGALRREGALLLTIVDTIVVPDAGYDGSAPDGDPAAAGSVWAYGTTMVDVRLGAPVVPQPYDTSVAGIDGATITRATNTIEVYAWRAGAATWDGCAHVAAEINLPVCGA